MPFYEFEHKDEIIEEFYPMGEAPKEIERDGKIYTYKPTFGGSFILKGQGWASKGTALASSPKHYKQVGLKVDHDLRNRMAEAGEKV